MTASRKTLFGFHAVAARLRHDAKSVHQLYIEARRKDRRMLDFLARAAALGVQAIPVDGARLDGLAGSDRHQGVVAIVEELHLPLSIGEVLDLAGANPLLLVLDSITDPHNLGACLRVADALGVHAVVAPKDRSAGLTPTVAKVASGAAETVPFIAVTNLARAMEELKDLGLQVIGADESGPESLLEAELTGPLAWVLGAEGEGMRRLTRERCDRLVRIPMLGSVESLNVSVAAGLCLYETRRQRALTRAARPG